MAARGAMWWVGGYGADMEGTALGVGVMVERPDGGLDYSHVAAPMLSPTFLARRGDHLYAAAEGAGRVQSFFIAAETLTTDGVVPSGGGWPCHLEFADDALVVSNYQKGEVALVSLTARGAVADLVQTIPGSGSGPHKQQDGPHAHAALRLDADTILTADLGADRLLVHAWANGRLDRTGEVVMSPGTGPRDLARHPSGLVFVLGEHGRTLSAYTWSAGALELVTSILLPGAEDGDQGAAIGFGPHGYVYCGLRGSNRVSVMRASADGRDIEPVGFVDSGGGWPRHLAVDGDRLHVANQGSNEVASFRLGSDGIPVLLAQPTPVPSPTYLLKA